MKVLRKGISLITFLIVIAGIFSGCNSKENKTFQKMQDFENAKIGVLLGSSFDILAKEYFPKADRLYFMNITDLILNLKQEKIDGILMDKGFFTPLAWEGENLSYIQMDMPATEYAVAFPKNKNSEKIKNQNFEHEDVLGDIVISIERVEGQAKEYGHSFERELAYMVVHSFYHLMGYDHIEEKENIAYKAAELFFSKTGISKGAKIQIEKNNKKDKKIKEKSSKY